MCWGIEVRLSAAVARPGGTDCKRAVWSNSWITNSGIITCICHWRSQGALGARGYPRSLLTQNSAKMHQNFILAQRIDTAAYYPDPSPMVRRGPLSTPTPQVSPYIQILATPLVSVDTLRRVQSDRTELNCYISDAVKTFCLGNIFPILPFLLKVGFV